MPHGPLAAAKLGPLGTVQTLEMENTPLKSSYPVNIHNLHIIQTFHHNENCLLHILTKTNMKKL